MHHYEMKGRLDLVPAGQSHIQIEKYAGLYDMYDNIQRPPTRRSVEI